MPTIPFVATYRLQVHGAFTLADAADQLDYLAALGVSHAYTSPLFAAVPGSTHGYDVVDPSRIDDERGGEEGYRRFSETLAEHGLGHVLDIVPNHMAASPRNPWWWDVLHRGRRSPAAAFFDIDWEPDTPELQGRVLVPILGRPLAEAVREKEVTVDASGDEPVVRYYEHALPLALERLDEPDREAVVAGEELAADRLLAALDRQPYRLAHWRRARGELNYRRFFDVNDLVGVRQEDPEVFAATHARVVELVREGRVHGLRVDHPDGLRDPEGYLARLAGATGGVWTVVEKILEPGESLRRSWPVAGTTGYEMGAMIGGLFVDRDAEVPLRVLWEELTGDDAGWDEVVRRSKLRAMAHVLPAEAERLRSALIARLGEETDPDAAGEVLRETLAAFPVYRTYVRGRDRQVDPADVAAVEHAVGVARGRRPDLPAALFGRLADALLLRDGGDAGLAETFQQVSGPVMAKGVEDTAFYAWTPFVALAEVGDSPGRFGVPPGAFHAFCRDRAARWPTSLNGLSTHDSKRSADVRARLALLSELPDAWADAVRRWHERNARWRSDGFPDPAAELLYYQTLVGAWPLPVERAVAYMEKAAREAKVHTTWTRPDPAYEAALRRFVESTLADEDFRSEVDRFVAPLVGPGRVNALAMQLLSLTAPGVPDLYQGDELWNPTLVDPDNRRPVDWARRRRLLDALTGEPDPATILARADEGLPKLWTIRSALALRRRRPETFGANGSYVEIAPQGDGAEHVVAFGRGRAGAEPSVVVAVPRLGLRRGEGWRDTRIPLPRRSWRHVLTGERLEGGEVPVESLFRRFPVAVLEDAP